MRFAKKRFLSFFVLALFFASCIQSGKPTPVTGKLATNFTIVKDSSFSPNNIKVVSGSSITFVNNTSGVHTIVSQDGKYLKPAKIESGDSYFFKKDATGTVDYKCMTHPSVAGVIKFLP